MARKSRRLKVGDKAPSFRLTDAVSGVEISLEDSLGHPLLIVFFRGTW
jgi:peroxiredoxin